MKARFGTAAVAAGAVLLASAGGAPGTTAGSLKKGGTLKVDLQADPGPLDPSLAHGTISWQIEYAIALKLVNYPDAEGAKGKRLVPEAAVRMPNVSNGGKTYTFTIKKGLRFSDGSKLTAKNFKWAFDRVASRQMQSLALPFVQDVSSVESRGLKFIIRLKAPSPVFPEALTMPYFQAIPHLPVNPKGVNKYPSPGPYYIASYVKGRRLVLKKNKFYKGSRPSNPNQIRFSIGKSLEQAGTEVDGGTADYAGDGVPPAAWAELRARFGVNKKRFWVRPATCTNAVALNTSRGLFKNNLKLRKAVNYAIGRKALVNADGFAAGKPWSHILSPGVPGFKQARIYPNTPNLDKAKKLAKGHLKNGTINVWYRSGDAARMSIIDSDLAKLGLDVKPHAFPNVAQKAGVKGAPFDAVDMGWCQDFPDPYDYLNILLDGGFIHEENNTNLSYFNNQRVNELLEAAAGKTGPARYKAYGNLDIMISKNYAPWAAYSNPNARLFVSDRFDCFVYNPIYGLDLAAACLGKETPPAPTCSQFPTLQLSPFTDSFGAYEGQVVGQCSGFTTAWTQQLNVVTGGKQIFGYSAHTPSACSPGTLPTTTLTCHVKPDGRICFHFHLGLVPAVPGDQLDFKLFDPNGGLWFDQTSSIPAASSTACNPGD